MFCKRIAQVFLLSTGFCVLGVGCSAVSALVSSSPAGSGASRKAPEHYAAIARVFENQGRYAQAQAMYRQALKVQPNNSVVQDRLQMLAAKTQQKSAVEAKTAQAIAMVDQMKPGDKTKKPASTSSTTTAAAHLASAQAAPAQSVKIQLATITAEPSDDADTAQPLITAATRTAQVSDSPEKSSQKELSIDNSGDPAAGLVSISLNDLMEESRSNSLTFAPGRAAADNELQQVSFDHTEGSDNLQVVTLADAVLLMDAPESHRDQLLNTLRYGEDEGVKALAASALSGCPEDPEVDEELRLAAESDSALLQLSALESLIERNQFTDSQVELLLELLAADASAIRVQGAVVIRKLADSDWSIVGADAVAALLNDPDPAVVAAAAASMGDFGDAASAYRNQLEELVRDAIDEEVARAATSTLNRLPAGEQSATVAVKLPEPELQETADRPAEGTLLPTVD